MNKVISASGSTTKESAVKKTSQVKSHVSDTPRIKESEGRLISGN